MTKAQAQSLIVKLIDQMQAADAEIQIESARKPNFDDAPAKEMVTAAIWLKDFFDNHFADVIKTRALLPKEIWDMYKMLGHDDMREQVLLKSLYEKCCEAWKDRPDFLKVKKRNQDKCKHKRYRVNESDEKVECLICGKKFL